MKIKSTYNHPYPPFSNKMARTIEIKKIGTDKLDNSLHVRYHSELYGIVHRFDLTKIGLPNELMNEWDGDLKVEGNINKEALMNVNTELMDKKDVERDNLLTFIFSLIRDYRLSPEASEVEAAKMLYTLIRAYDRIQQKSNDRESADIDGLVTDLSQAAPCTRGTRQDGRGARPNLLRAPKRLQLRQGARGERPHRHDGRRDEHTHQ